MPVEKSISRILGKVGADFCWVGEEEFSKVEEVFESAEEVSEMTCLIPLLASVTVLQCYIFISDVLNHIK